ncbi:hypothetical protein PQO03_15870 [Lentisphaera profundi]|uniref:Outer membrane protein beta-barrel domain-containing protein n=1 Tax=Lentisphaera profundi TaxID=1658616 RepID=A0ABY7W178_9BACT|nr:hypothetical protein [Lentisphaera profundi]WDE99314.1 hypothetical protein PQO03_15870 [Lentisphaera profundi]
MVFKYCLNIKKSRSNIQFLGGGFGRFVKFDRHVVNLSIRAYYNGIRPDKQAEWSTRLQIQYFFPKQGKVFLSTNN